MDRKLDRRLFQRLCLTLPPSVLAATFGVRRASDITFAQSDDATPPPDGTPILAPTPACGDDDDFEETVEQTEGPFYTPDTPERASLLEPGISGTKLVVTGYVYSTDCQPVSGALLDFWHADDAGVYDNEGYLLRGHQFADDDGRYELTTILPGLYTGRTRHIHVKVQAPNQPVLTTQLYFPDEPDNETDGIFSPDLVIDLQDPQDSRDAQEEADADAGQLGFFTFVLDTD